MEKLALELATLLRDVLSNTNEDLAYLISLNLVDQLEAMQPIDQQAESVPSQSGPTSSDSNPDQSEAA
tara:strand:+ start:1223 stop:1426 length:204 start_codon:yes stop_codon:yes gene_type:complete